MSENAGSKATLFAKMAKVMGELSTFHKDAQNKFHGYGYVSAHAVTERIGRAMANAGIAFFSSTVGMQATDDKRYIVEYEFTFACAESGASVSSRWFGEAVHTTSKGALDDKALNKAATTALKYFLLNTFVVSAAEDVDVDASESQQKQSGKKKPAQTFWTSDLPQMDWLKAQVEKLRASLSDQSVNDAKAQLDVKNFTEAKAYFAMLSKQATEIEAALAQASGE